jgi:hypothetical protein
MFSFFQTSNKSHKIGFEDVLVASSQPSKYILINTIESNNQHCLIHNTVSIESEETLINQMLTSYDTSKTVIVYGKHSADETVDKKYNQMRTLGLMNVYIYVGGIFEWLLLQEVFGEENFKTTSKPKDLLKYKPPQTI